MIKLVYTSQGAERTFESRMPQILIGRPKEGVIVNLDLTPETTVSRPHARIWLEAGRYWIEDLKSTRGTKVNGEKLKAGESRELHGGEKLQIGNVVLFIEFPAGNQEDGQHNGSDSTLPEEDLQSEINFVERLDAKTASFIIAEGAEIDLLPRLSLLYSLPLRFARESQLNLLLQSIVEELIKVIPAAVRGAILLKEAATRKLVLRAHLPTGKPAVSMTFAQRAIESCEAFIWEHREAKAPPSAFAHNIETGMYAPLIWRDEALGVICVDNTNRECAFALRDLHLLLAVAHYAAMALAQQRAEKALRQHSELTSRLFSSRFPPELRENLIQAAAAGSLPIGTQQTPVSVLTADIRGFTQLTQRLGAQRMSDLLNEYFPPLIEAIHRNKGTIERFVGDAIFAVFGSPKPDLDHYLHAVNAALDMQATVELVSTSRAARGVETCGLGIGVDCGDVLHGFIGNAEWMEFAVVGEAANLASRYCSGAGKGEILVSRDIYDRVFREFQAEQIDIPTKHEGTISAFRVTGRVG